ncbi:DUF962 domain-containing protein [Sinimarinibacterium sp. CAU 1509]|uniref:Mpo1 family 2-hydroxy fatty acid dioxygenase n=1 Tax=Sinimarinibacterium sp. CAU 1509 TaxID=2562283 RepID=UPI0010ABBAEF|nr:Mpo1-like protein [Sinimarinibacterium sp. CAU 1509]TJY64687.1 DUF962 domain-containing protein [Sinimarinibacterium sp. CAU 1509]
MRSYTQLMNEYESSHRNPVNRVIHMICVPLIYFTSVALLWSASLAWLVPGVSPAVAPWINLATLLALPVAVFYARLGAGSLFSGVLWMLIAGLACFALQVAGVALPWIAVPVWLVAWVVQIYGHKIEGAKPSFFDDVVFLLIGPLFVQAKFVALLQRRPLHA